MSKKTEKSEREQLLARIFFALGDRTRLAIVTKLLAAGALSATALADGEAISRQAITKHLNVLEEAGLVSHARQGREVRYALELQRLQEARAFLDAIAAGWDRALGRLRDIVES